MPLHSIIHLLLGELSISSHFGVWEVLMLVNSEAVAQVSGVAQTVDYFG